MKLRLRGDSVRLRLTRSEVAALVDSGIVEACTRFGPDRVFRYRVGANGSEAAVFFEKESLALNLPEDRVRAWAGSNEIVLAAEQVWPGGVAAGVGREGSCLCEAPRRRG